MKLWDAFLEDYGNEVFDWPLRGIVISDYDHEIDRDISDFDITHSEPISEQKDT